PGARLLRVATKELPVCTALKFVLVELVFRKNSTLEIVPSESKASAMNVILALAGNLDPFVGAVIFTTGGMFVGGSTVRIAGLLVTEPAELLTTTVYWPELLVWTLIKASPLVVAPAIA